MRRRRWIRLMVRPATVIVKEGKASENFDTFTVRELDDVWKGDEGDWERYHALARRLRDPRKLDAWEVWIGRRKSSAEIATARKQWSEDEDWLPSEKARIKAAAEVALGYNEATRPLPAYVLEVLRSHVSLF